MRAIWQRFVIFWFISGVNILLHISPGKESSKKCIPTLGNDLQAGFNCMSAVIMACCFAITTPTGIAIGIGISSSYNEKSTRSLVVEGIFDSISAGILVYMSLVDLIAADFLSKRMRCNRRLQVYSYVSLLSGCSAMSALAIWTWETDHFPNFVANSNVIAGIHLICRLWCSY